MIRQRFVVYGKGLSRTWTGEPLVAFGLLLLARGLQVADYQFHLAFEFNLVHGARCQQVAAFVDGVAADGAFAVDD